MAVKLNNKDNYNCYLKDPLSCTHEQLSEPIPIQHPVTFVSTEAYKCLECGTIIINGQRCEGCHG